MLLAEQITTISRSAFRNCLGRIRDPGKMAEIESAVLAQVAINKPQFCDDADTDESIEPAAEGGREDMEDAPEVVGKNDTDDQEDL